MQHMDELCERRGDQGKRRVWLHKKIELVATMGTATSDRAKYLAAQSQLTLADDARAAFDAIELTDPLAASLKRKQQVAQGGDRRVRTNRELRRRGVRNRVDVSDRGHLCRVVARPDGIGASEGSLRDWNSSNTTCCSKSRPFPFEEQAISIHEINVRRSWDGVYDQWVQKSFGALRALLPARFDKQEVQVGYVETIR